MDEDVAFVVDEMIKNVEKLEKAEKFTLKAEKSGIGALLSRLRGAEEPSTSEIPPEKRPREDFSDGNRKLNRKERRALQQAELKEKYEENKKIEVVVPKVYGKAKVPYLVSTSCDEKSFQNYKATFGYTKTRGNNYVRYSLLNKDGKYAAVAAQDRYLRVYDMENPSTPLWTHNMGGLIYGVSWCNDTNAVLTTSKDHPIHMWDGATGERIRAFIGKDHADAVDTAFCVANVGNTIIGGYKKNYKVWDIERGGNPINTVSFYDKDWNSGLNGRPMTIDSCPVMKNTFAVAGASERVAIYSDQCKTAVNTIIGSNRGYTHLKYSDDGIKLYASERKGDIHCFDVRMEALVQVFKREMNANHRAIFDIDFESRHLYSGTSTGKVVCYDIGDFNEDVQPMYQLKVARTCVPCVSVTPGKLILCSGERIFPLSDLCDSDEEAENKLDSVSLYPSNSFQVFDICTVD